LRVLVADDDAPIRLLWRINLETQGFEVVEACDGEEAVAAALASVPDVALLDVLMPRLDGWQVAQRLRQEQTTRAVALVFITALSDEETRKQAQSYGGSYLGKPFDPLTLPVIVSEAAAGRAA
jgi:DNA-binding response OmpR family regulator